MSFFFGTNVFLRYTITTRANSDQSSYEPAARGNDFQLSASNTQREEQEISNDQRKYLANFRKNYFVTLR